MGPGKRDRHRWVALVVVCVAALIINVDNTILNVALPTLVRELHATSSELQWIVDSYAMVFAGLLFVGGSLADRFGRRRFFLTGLSIFAAGSIGAAFSGSVHLLIACRAVMGAGAALTIPASLSIINDTFRDPTERARAIGAWAGTIGLGIAVGPIAGGLLLSRFWWGSIFLVNVPIVCVGLVGAVIFVTESKNPHVERPDPVGALLSIVGLGFLLWSIIEGPDRGLVVGNRAGGRLCQPGRSRQFRRLGVPLHAPHVEFGVLSSSQLLGGAHCGVSRGVRADGCAVPLHSVPPVRSRTLTPGGGDSHPPHRCHADSERGAVPLRFSFRRGQGHRRHRAVADHCRVVADLGGVGVRDDVWRRSSGSRARSGSERDCSCRVRPTRSSDRCHRVTRAWDRPPTRSPSRLVVRSASP